MNVERTTLWGRGARRIAAGVAAGAIAVFSAGATTACAEDGCETVKGKYRLILALSAGRGCEPALEVIVDTEAAVDTSGCTRNVKQTEGTSTCRQETTSTCPNGDRSLDVLECEDDGERCSGTLQVELASGGGCIYDYSATRL